MKPDLKAALAVVESRHAELRQAAPTETVRVKLANLHDVCRHLVVTAGQRLTVPSVVSAYAARFVAKDQSLAESSIRNRRDGANPYHELYRSWESVAEACVAPAKTRGPVAAIGDIIAIGEVAGIQDAVLRHRVSLLVGQNRSLRNEVNILKKARGAPVVRIQGDVGEGSTKDLPPLTSRLVLTESELDAIRDFIDPRKLGSRHLRRAPDGAVETRDGRTMADPGLCDALEKIVQSYGQ